MSCYPPCHGPQRQSVPETGAYTMLRLALADLRKAERALTIVEQAAPDAERGADLVAIRTALSELTKVVRFGSET
jgi:hypothetical protein